MRKRKKKESRNVIFCRGFRLKKKDEFKINFSADYLDAFWFIFMRIFYAINYCFALFKSFFILRRQCYFRNMSKNIFVIYFKNIFNCLRNVERELIKNFVSYKIF